MITNSTAGISIFQCVEFGKSNTDKYSFTVLWDVSAIFVVAITMEPSLGRWAISPHWDEGPNSDTANNFNSES